MKLNYITAIQKQLVYFILLMKHILEHYHQQKMIQDSLSLYISMIHFFIKTSYFCSVGLASDINQLNMILNEAIKQFNKALASYTLFTRLTFIR